LQTLLNSYAQMRTQLAAELERALAPGVRRKDRLPGDSAPDAVRSRDSAVRAGGSRDSDGTLNECRAHDEHCLKHYQWVLKRDLPHALRQIVSRQHAAMQADYQQLCQLLHSAGGDANANAGSRSAIEHGAY
jgi:hypothetical protein